MYLSIATTYQPATDLGFLLHKHPGRVHETELPFGKAVVFYPEASDARCEAALVLDVDPVGLVRGKGRSDGLLDQYVNDRPYAASSFLSVALGPRPADGHGRDLARAAGAGGRADPLGSCGHAAAGARRRAACAGTLRAAGLDRDRRGARLALR